LESAVPSGQGLQREIDGPPGISVLWLAQHAPAGYVASLHLAAAAIVASNGGPRIPSTVRRQLDNDRCVAGIWLSATSRTPVTMLSLPTGCRLLRAFDDGGVWLRNLESLGGGELSLECPRCGDHLLLPLDGPGIRQQRSATPRAGRGGPVSAVGPGQPAKESKPVTVGR
jgi:hypothetical protein